MSYNKEDLINYRLNKAERSLEEAEVMAKLDHWDTKNFLKQITEIIRKGS